MLILYLKKQGKRLLNPIVIQSCGYFNRYVLVFITLQQYLMTYYPIIKQVFALLLESEFVVVYLQRVVSWPEFS